jgi:hypothetical protein
VTGLLNRTLANGGGNTFYNAASSDGPGTRVWAQVDGGTLSIDSSSQNSQSTADTAGLSGGFDISLAGQARIGLAVAYDYQWLHDLDGGKATENGLQLSLYGSQPLGPIGVSAVISYAHGYDTVERATGIGQAYAKRGLDDYSGAVQLSAPFTTGGLDVTPAAGVYVSDLTSGGFSETFTRSAAFAVSGGGKDFTSVSPYANIGFSHAFVSSNGTTITPDVLVGYRYDDGARGQDETLIAADGTVFGGNRVGLSRSTGVVGGSLTASRNGWTAYVKYRANLASGWTDQSVALGVRMAF